MRSLETRSQIAFDKPNDQGATRIVSSANGDLNDGRYDESELPVEGLDPVRAQQLRETRHAQELGAHLGPSPDSPTRKAVLKATEMCPPPRRS